VPKSSNESAVALLARLISASRPDLGKPIKVKLGGKRKPATPAKAAAKPAGASKAAKTAGKAETAPKKSTASPAKLAALAKAREARWGKKRKA